MDAGFLCVASTLCMFFFFACTFYNIMSYYDLYMSWSKKQFRTLMYSSFLLLILPLWYLLSIVHVHKTKYIESINVTIVENKPIIVIYDKTVNLAGKKDRNWVCDSVDIEITKEAWSLGVKYPQSWELVGETNEK